MEFEILVNQHKDAVYRQLLRVCGNQQDAEDVLIDALLRAWRHLDQLNDPRAFRSWLAQIGRRVCWHLREREALMPLLQLSSMPEDGAGISSGPVSMEDNLDRARMKAMVQTAITALPEEIRAVYQLRDLQGLSGIACAEQLGITEAAMKSRLHRARKQLREHLDHLLAEKTS